MTTKVLVTGAAGNVGSRLVKRLARHAKVRAFVRPGEKADFPAEVERFEGDLADRERVRAAAKGVDAIYLLATGPELTKLEANVIDAAAAERVGRVVKHSVQGAEAVGSAIPRWHREGEKRLEQSGLAYTFLRPASFASNTLGWAGMAKGGAIYGPYGEAALPVIDPDDIAAVAEKVLTEPGHNGKAYTITGPTALTAAEQVAIVSEVIGKPLSYVNVPDEAARESMLGLGWPPAWVDGMIELVQGLRHSGGAPATDTVSTLLGRPPRSFAQFIADHASVFA